MEPLNTLDVDAVGLVEVNLAGEVGAESRVEVDPSPTADGE